MGDCVGLVATNSTNIGAVVFAALTIGVSVNPLDTSFKSNEIAHMFHMTKPKIVFCDFEKIDSVKSAVKNLGYNVTIVTIGGRCDDCDFIDNYLVKDVQEASFV